jgi:ubiquinone/menaquinone biosynthesis C-methylase UbiE
VKTYYSGEHAKNYNRTWATFSQKTHAVTLSLIDLAQVQHAASIAERAPRFLDVACGTGLLLERFAHLVSQAEVYGIDGSEEMLSQAQRLLEGHPHAQLIQGTLNVGAIAGLPYAPASFDVITCTNTFHYLQDPVGVIRELKQFLAPQGQFVIEDYARRRFPFPWRLFEWVIKRSDPQHIRAYTLSEAQDLCRQAGVEVVSSRTFTVNVVWHGWALRARAGIGTGSRATF